MCLCVCVCWGGACWRFGKKRRQANRRGTISRKRKEGDSKPSEWPVTGLGGKEIKVVMPAGQCVGLATGSESFSLGGLIFFSLKLVGR